MKERSLLVLLVLLFVNFFAFSQKPEFEHIADNEGVIHTGITAILKDSYGYMWFGAFGGLSKYDGYTFTNYTHDPKNKHSIPDNYIRSIYESKDRTLYVGFQYTGISIFNRETETFTRFRHSDTDTNSLVHDYILTITGDSRGNIWIGTRGGLDRFDPKTRKFIHYNKILKQDFMVSSIAEDKAGNLWMYGKGDEICKFNPETNKAEYIGFSGKVYRENSFYRGGTIKCDSRGYLWIGNEVNGLFRYNPKTGKCDVYSTQNQTLESNIVFSVIEDSQGRIWIGTDGGGLYQYNYSTNTFQKFKNDPNDVTSLSSNAIYCLYESEPGLLWIGVYKADLNVLKSNKIKFQKYTATGVEGKRLSQQSVLSIAKASGGKIWLGTDGGGLNLFDPKTSTFEYYTTENSIVKSNIVKSILVDNEGNVWLGSYGKGLSKINFGKKSIINYRPKENDKENTILHEHVWSLCQSSDSNIWIGMLSYGVMVWDKDLKKFIHHPYDSVATGKAICSIQSLLEDSKKRIWVGSEIAGLGYYDPSKNVFVRFQYQNGKKGTISDFDISNVFEDSKGTIWVGTFKGGLNKIVDVEKKIVESYTMEDGLPSNHVKTILEDDHGNLWIATEKGISWFKVNEKKFVNFSTDDGLQEMNFNYNCGLKTSDGYLYFGGIKGFNCFHPDSIRFNTKPPVVVMTDFKLFNESIRPNIPYKDKVYLSRTISMTDEIVLTHHDYVFSFEFATLDFQSPSKNKYAYQLEGFDDKWTYVNADKRFATYTNLNPGVYVFKVIAANNDGLWNNEGTSVRIIVLPPWWMTWWFRTISVLAGIFVIAGVFYYRMRSVREENKFLEEEVRNRTAALKEANDGLQERNKEILAQQKKILQQKNKLEHLNKTKDKFFSIIGHDLRGPVKALTSLTSMLQKEASTADNALQDLIRHTDLSAQQIKNLVLNLLEWARTQSDQVKVDTVEISTDQLLQENVKLHFQQASQKQIEITIQSDPSHLIMADYNMISTVVRNILNNSIKYTPRGGKIVLASSRTRENEIKISISDNGIGMSPEILAKLFALDKGASVKGTENETGTGLGMIISQEFVNLNKGKIYAESTEGIGSTFYIILPSKNN